MNDVFYVIWAIGALALAGGAFASYRMNWRRSLIYVFIWASLFTGATLLISVIGYD